MLLTLINIIHINGNVLEPLILSFEECEVFDVAPVADTPPPIGLLGSLR